MKQHQLLLTLTLGSLLITLNACQLVGDIFKAGVWTGVLMIVGIIALVIFLIAKATRK